MYGGPDADTWWTTRSVVVPDPYPLTRQRTITPLDGALRVRPGSAVWTTVQPALGPLGSQLWSMSAGCVRSLPMVTDPKAGDADASTAKTAPAASAPRATMRHPSR